jgi:hypothetical protein
LFVLHRDAAAAAVAAAFAWSEPAGILAAQNGHSDVASLLQEPSKHLVTAAFPASHSLQSTTYWL